MAEVWIEEWTDRNGVRRKAEVEIWSMPARQYNPAGAEWTPFMARPREYWIMVTYYADGKSEDGRHHCGTFKTWKEAEESIPEVFPRAYKNWKP